MKKILFAKAPIQWGVGLVRAATGIIIASYGIEIFSQEQIHGYTQWLSDIQFPYPGVMAYVGKFAELGGGILLALGLFTRLATIPLVTTMVVITFVMGEGNIRSDSFYLMLAFLFYFFNGPGSWSLDYLLIAKKPAQDAEGMQRL